MTKQTHEMGKYQEACAALETAIADLDDLMHIDETDGADGQGLTWAVAVTTLRARDKLARIETMLRFELDHTAN